MAERKRTSGLQFLVIGCGSIGRRHIGNLIALQAGSVSAFDPDEERRREAAVHYGIEVFSDLDQAWAGGPDAAVIAVPTSLHVPIAMQAAGEGCHLFIEKPLSHSLDGIGPLLDVVRRKHLTTLVGCNLRFHPGLKKIKEMLDREALGRVVSARVEFGQYLPDWRPQDDYRLGYSARRSLGGGIILDAIHELDYIRWMLGEVDTVACLAGKLSSLEIDTEDTASILLAFASGAFGEVHLDYLQRVYRRTCQVIGEEGTLLWNYSDRLVRHLSAGNKNGEAFPDPEDWEPNRMYLDEMAHFLRCLRGGERPTLDMFEAARVLEIADATKRSVETRQFISLGGAL